MLSFVKYIVNLYLAKFKGKAVKIAYSLDEALNNIAVVQNTMKPVAEFEGRLIYLSGPISVSEPLTEPDYGVMVACVKLKRRAQMYQWIEIEEDRRYIYYFDLNFQSLVNIHIGNYIVAIQDPPNQINIIIIQQSGKINWLIQMIFT